MADVYKLKRNNKKKHRLLKAAVSVLALAAISVSAAVLITNNGELNAAGFIRLFTGSGNKTQAAEFSFTSGTGSVYAEMNGGLAVCSGSSIQVYDAAAKKMFSEVFEMTCPAISSNGELSVVYDLGGTSLKVFDVYGVTHSMTTEGKIIAVSVSKSGWLALCTQETGGYKSRVTVYDNQMAEHYKWYSAEGYVLSAAVSPDNKSLAVLTLTDKGSRAVFFSLNSPDEKGSCVFSRNLVLDIKYLNDSKMVAVGEESLSIVKPDGSIDVIQEYTDKHLVGYSTGGDGFTVLVLNDYLVGDQGSISSVDRSGKVLGTIPTSQKVLSVSANGDYTAVLYSGSLIIYDKNLKETARFKDTAGAEQTIMRADGKAFLISSHSAAVFEAKQEKSAGG